MGAVDRPLSAAEAQTEWKIIANKGHNFFISTAFYGLFCGKYNESFRSSMLHGGYFSGKAVQTIAGKRRSKTVERTLFYKNKAIKTTLFLFLENSSL
jgi:hypothetical protein